MSSIPEGKVPKKARDLFEKGMAAMERNNVSYAMDMFKSAIDVEPRFLKARKFLMAASLKNFKESGGSQATHVITTLTSLPALVGATIGLKTGRSEKALVTAGGLLVKDPLNMNFVRLLAKAAEASDMPEVAIQALEIVKEFYHENTDILMWLGTLYMKTNQLKEAQDTFSTLADLSPNDSQVKRLLKNAMAAGTLSKGWAQAADEGSSYDLLKDSKEASMLEQQDKSVRSAEATQMLIDEHVEKVKNEPKNVNYRRALVKLYVDAKQFDKAIQSLDEAQEALGQDPQMEQILTETTIKKFEWDIKQLRDKGDIEAAEALAAEKDEYRFDQLRAMVERYPNDLQLHYQYGIELFDHGMYNEAIHEFQQAQKNPQRRVVALYHVGMCFIEKGQLDMAREQLEKAIAEAPDMNDLRKGILYELGRIEEQEGDFKTAVDKYYKEIYQADIGFKDVATKIEQAYRK